MDDFLKEYFQDDVGPIIAKKILKKIDQASNENWSKAEFHSNLHNVYVDLKNEQVKITGLLITDPQVVLSLNEYKSKLRSLIEK